MPTTPRSTWRAKIAEGGVARTAASRARRTVPLEFLVGVALLRSLARPASPPPLALFDCWQRRSLPPRGRSAGATWGHRLREDRYV